MRSRRVRATFDELVELEEEERTERLEALRRAEPDVHREVVELLAADRRAPAVLDRFEPLPPVSGSARQRVADDLRRRIESALQERYRVQGEVGRGGMSTVFRALDLGSGRPVALKVLEPDVTRAIGPERFLREIAIERRLHHPGILRVLESGEADGLLYYAMPYAEGESLRNRLDREGRLPLAEALAIGVQCADALAHAHESGVIHRDVKPANILLSGGRALLGDFGVARALHQTPEERLTRTGVSVGTVGYMSPEQVEGTRDPDGRADVYGLGCVLYEMLAGEPAFSGPTHGAILARQMTWDPPALALVRPGLPNGVEAAIRTALQPDPDRRYPTAAAFAAELRALGDDAGPSH